MEEEPSSKPNPKIETEVVTQMIEVESKVNEENEPIASTYLSLRIYNCDLRVRDENRYSQRNRYPL